MSTYLLSENADRWIAKLLDALEAIEKNPGIGHTREDLTALPVLFFAVGVCSSYNAIVEHQ